MLLKTDNCVAIMHSLTDKSTLHLENMAVLKMEEGMTEDCHCIRLLRKSKGCPQYSETLL